MSEMFCAARGGAAQPHGLVRGPERYTIVPDGFGAPIWPHGHL